MIDFLLLYCDYGIETGVTVSVGHLSRLMSHYRISYKIIPYKNDSELLHAIKSEDAYVIMLHGPSFSKDTLKKILEQGKETTLAIHSTIAFLQVEEGAFNRTFDYLNMKYDNWSMCNPDLAQVEGFRTYLDLPIYYLPNTYNPTIEKFDNLDLKSPSIYEMEKRYSNRPFKISVFCSLIPFKNIPTQMTALSIANKYAAFELHLLKFNNLKSNVYTFIKRISEMFKYKTIWHDSCPNQELLKLVSEMTIGMQVSYTETLSYILLEHMIMGIPTIGSSAIPFAIKNPKFNDPLDISNALLDIISNENTYLKYAQEAFEKASQVKAENDKNALEVLNILLNRAKSL